MTEALTAVSPAWEGQVATALEQVPGVTIARRCADVAELLSVAEAGLGDLAVVSDDLRDLDLEVVKRLQDRRVRVVGLHLAADEGAERRLLQLGVDATASFEASLQELGGAVTGERSGLDGAWPAMSGRADGTGSSDRGTGSAGAPSRSAPRPADLTPAGHEDDWTFGARTLDEAAPAAEPSAGKQAPAHDVSDHGSGPPDQAAVIAVWGPTGAPGRTTIATTLAAELAQRGAKVLLVDADTYGGAVAQALGVLDEAPGVAAACRAADLGALDVPALSRIAPEVMDGLRVLTGLPRADRWLEVRAAALERVLNVSRSLVEIVVVDCGFCLEDDEELSYDTLAPRRNEATLTALAASDTVVAVAGADPTGLQRFVRGIEELRTVQSGRPVPVVNRVRAAAVGSRPQSRIADSLRRFAGLEVDHFIPDDPPAADAALLTGRSVVELAPGSRLRAAVGELATALAPWTVPESGRAARRSAGWPGSARRSRQSRRVRA